MSNITSTEKGPASPTHGNSACNGPIKLFIHDWFCSCHWCMNGVK